ncbi:hypothetical protein GCM10027030_22240 [Luteococcus sediminum]
MSKNQTPRRHTAGVFDIRTMIGLLMGLYGLLLTGMGLFSHVPLDKTGGINANLWAGIALLGVGAVFLTWARLRPVVVDEARLEQDRQEEQHLDRP